VSLAARGTRNISGVEETIQDQAELEQVRAQAKRVYVESAVAALGLTALALLAFRNR